MKPGMTLIVHSAYYAVARTSYYKGQKLVGVEDVDFAILTFSDMYYIYKRPSPGSIDLNLQKEKKKKKIILNFYNCWRYASFF